MRRALLVFMLFLLAPAGAWAGGMATAGLSSTPAGKAPGEKWDVDITIMQHGVTPMTDVTPAVVITLPDGGEKRFPGTKTDTPGVYRASVVFPEAGTYSYRVDDGFTNAVPHTFPPVEISGAPVSAPAAAVDDDGFPWWLIPIAAGALALAVTLSGRARARQRAASSAAPRSAPAGAPGPNG